MKRKLTFYIFGFILVVCLVCSTFMTSKFGEVLMQPSRNHWCGTGLFGEDIFVETTIATGIEVLLLLVVSAIVWVSGIIFGVLISFPSNSFVRELMLSVIHVFATLPILLLALFMLILLGGGFVNSILILIIAILPSQILYAYNQFEQAKKEDFYLAKQSYGLSRLYIYKHHLFPCVIKKYNNYTLSRLPEITMMGLALDFLGLGIKAPTPSLGRMLFDGMSFMFSAWWLWFFPVISIIIIFSILSRYVRQYK